MVEVHKDTVIYGDGEGMECPALIIAVHESNHDILHPWLTVSIVEPDPKAMVTIKGVQCRQTDPKTKVPHRVNAGPGQYWREPE